MEQNVETNSPRSAVSYVCTNTENWQKYEAFIVKKEAEDYNFDIVASYRDYRDPNNGSNRQGYEQMVKDIQEGKVPPAVVVSNYKCLPTNTEPLNIDINRLICIADVIELDTLK
jgi:hypothetical protein